MGDSVEAVASGTNRLHRTGSRQRVSMIESEFNPLKNATDTATSLKVENLSECKLIAKAEMSSLMDLLNSIE
jgi:hypothetical protein